MLRKGFLLPVFLVFAGCATYSSIPELPDRLEGDGLLVGKLYMPGSFRWNYSQVSINGRLYNATLRDGYLAVRLAPGDYTLNHLRTEGWNDKVSARTDDGALVKVKGSSYRAPTYTYTPGTTTVTYYTTLPINQAFTIEANRITSLGLMVFLTDPKDPKKFYTFRLENPKEMSHFLDTNYPALMASLASHDLRAVSAKYLEAAKLKDLRQAIAVQEARAGYLTVLGNTSIATGGAGTIALLTPDPNGKKDAAPTLNILDTGTLADIKQIQAQGARLSFLTADAQMLIFDRGQLLKRSMPYRVQPQRFRRYGEKGVLVLDNRRRFLSSEDDGLTWKIDESAILEKPTNRLEVLAGRDGAYVYTTNGVPPQILVRNYSRPVHQILPGPQYSGRIPATSFARLRETDAGLFLDYAARDFHFRPTGQSEWQLRAAPDSGCGAMSIEPAGQTLYVTCNKVVYRSSDGGQNWERRDASAAASPSS